MTDCKCLHISRHGHQDDCAMKPTPAQIEAAIIALESKQPHTALKILKAALTGSALKDTP